MNRAPLGIVAAAFIAGILAARYADIPFIILWATALSALVFSLLFLNKKIIFLILLAASIVFLGALSFRNSQSLPSNHISNFTPYKGVRVSLEGVIDSDPVKKEKSAAFILKVQRLIDGKKERDVCGKVLVKVFGGGGFHYGDKLLMEGTIYRAPYFRISRRMNYRDYLKRRGIYTMLSVGKGSTVKLLDKGGGNLFKRKAFYIRSRVKEMIRGNMSPLSAGILGAIILGERETLDADVREAMVRTGTVHIIAISGLHVGLITFIVLMILRICRTPKNLSYAIAAFVLIIYCLLTGARIPVIRVTIMALILFFGYTIGRQSSIYNSLSAAALLILLYDPKQLFDISFQLSFISVISIAGLSPVIKGLFAKELLKRPLPRVLATAFSVSSSAWIGLSPLIVYYFNILSPIAIFANIIVVPYLSLVVGSGLLAILMGLICPPVSCIFFAASEAAIIFLVKIVFLLARVPGAYFYLN